MSQIKYLNQTYGGTPFMFFENKAAAEEAGRRGLIPDGVVVCTLDIILKIEIFCGIVITRFLW